MSTTILPLHAALAVEPDGDTAHAIVHEGFDVQGVPHGGYLAALLGHATVAVTGHPDLFTLTTHFLRKAAIGPIAVQVTPVGGSRRFTTVHATARQAGEVVLAGLVSLGDRTTMSGPTWTDRQPWQPHEARLSPPAGDPSLPFRAPGVAERVGLRLDTDTVAFAEGKTIDDARLRAVLDTDVVDQFTALVACDVTPPAAWNALGARGWVPTVELTAHVRARPEPGPLSVEAVTHHVGAGFLEEDAMVHDATGRLVVQSRQLARWTST